MAAPTQNTIGEVRAEANIILKVVDQCIKAGLLDDAKSHLEKARMIDPTNAYIYAFEERISFLKEEATKKNAAVFNRAAMEDAARAKLDAERRRAEDERLKRDAEHTRRIEEARQKKNESSANQENKVAQNVDKATSAPVVAKNVPEQKAASYTEVKPKTEPVLQRQQIEPENARKSEQQQPQKSSPTSPSQNSSPIKTQSQAYDMYKRVLLLAWADGAISPEEQTQLQDLQATLQITTEIHSQLELEAKEESYTHALSLVFSSGMNVKERSAVINELRQKYQISLEAHSKIEGKLLGEVGPPQNRPMIYVIDDEGGILAILVKILEGGGYDVKTFGTSDDALVGLKKDMPDLIISDINLETSTIGGFSFYEKVRQFQHLSHVPFIFLSGMTDEGMIRYGKSLGVDDYLTKPFTGEMLLDTIKGKLKRYKQMKLN